MEVVESDCEVMQFIICVKLLERFTRIALIIPKGMIEVEENTFVITGTDLVRC